MWFWAALLGPAAEGQERIFETSLVQKGGFIKAWGQEDSGAERAAAALGLRGDWRQTWGLWEVKIREVWKGLSYAKEEAQATSEGLASA